jgi:hypothetical protein
MDSRIRCIDPEFKELVGHRLNILILQGEMHRTRVIKSWLGIG